MGDSKNRASGGRKLADADPDTQRAVNATRKKAEERFLGGARSEADAAEGLFNLLSDDPEFGTEGSGEDGGSQRDEDDDVSRAADEVDDLEGEELDDEDVEAEDEEELDEDLIEVQVAGETERVTLEELKAGYSRTADYTRKTQELAKQREETQQAREDYLSRAEEYDQGLALVQQALQEQMPAEPDWDKLEREDPAKAATEWAKWQRHQQQLQAIQQERQRNYAAALQEQQKALQERVEEEKRKLFEVVPGWKDSKETREKELAEIAEYAREQGFSDEELNRINDHRAILVMRKAMLFDQLDSEGRQALEKKKAAAPHVKPGQTKKRSGKRRKKQLSEKARERLARSGRADDAAAAILGAGLIDD